MLPRREERDKEEGGSESYCQKSSTVPAPTSTVLHRATTPVVHSNFLPESLLPEASRNASCQEGGDAARQRIDAEVKDAGPD